MEFEEHETYYQSLAPQGSKEWTDLRIGRITMSNLAACTGRSSYGNDPYKTARVVCGLEPTVMNRFMEHGMKSEPIIRKWYGETFNHTIKEVGLAVWKGDPRFGGSLDGEINDEEGIEIKAPHKMYAKIIEYVEAKSKGYKFCPGYHEHILNSHYDQMLGNGIITNKKYMHYVVVCTDTQQAYVQKLLVDRDLWEKELYPKACTFYETYVEPLLKANNLRRIDPNF